MKSSRRNIRNAILRAEARSDGPPKVSKYAAKNGVTIASPNTKTTGGVVNQ